LWGVSEGEEVVSEGGYLIDSESQLRSGAGSMHEHEPREKGPPAAPSNHQH